jgi:hypothetical protein
MGQLLAAAGEGDMVVVSRPDRLGRPLPDLLRLVEDLAGRVRLLYMLPKHERSSPSNAGYGVLSPPAAGPG